MRTPYAFCSSCQTPFFYPLLACTLCGKELITRDPREYTIVGTTTVNVPSTEHPKVPYHVLRLEDEFGVTHLRKTMRQYSVGQTIVRENHTMGSETVLLAKAGYHPARSLQALLTDLQTPDIPSDQRVVIHLGITPTPVGVDFLEGVLTYLQTKGLAKDRIAFVARLPEHMTRERFLEKNNLTSLIQVTQLTDLGSVNHETIKGGDTLYDVPHPLISTDWLLHLACVQLSETTPNAPITTSLAEIFPGGVGIRTQRALDLSPTSTKVLPRRLFLVDGRSDNGLSYTKPLFLGGESPLALDRALCAIYHVPAEEAVKNTAITIVGEELDAL